MRYPDYLTAKRTVDDRALNPQVIEVFSTHLRDRGKEGSVSILEIGAGTGTMIARLAERGVLPPRTSYRAIDRNPVHVAAGREHVPKWLTEAGYAVDGEEDGIVAEQDDDRLEIQFEVGDAFAIDTSSDVCIAMAVLDLVDLPDSLEPLMESLEPGGLLYAPLTFDGGTRFAPLHPADSAIEDAYHRHMAEIREGGGPHAGRRLLEAVPLLDGELLAVGDAAQVIHPQDETYFAREELVLSTLLETVVEAVREVPDSGLSVEVLDEWVGIRREQLDRGELSFMASNLDVLARF